MAVDRYVASLVTPSVREVRLPTRDGEIILILPRRPLDADDAERLRRLIDLLVEEGARRGA